ncbi:hypothetical protein [Flavobacterium sp.]|jgi:hypothetical protein|uniref:hypothetical protein n=1 Tax=Flavobacterium sp. TaxID=239 RepID=UPI0022C0B8AF|nr:hypothetical protein [Flavobacterium sp.]MCZ8089343.1 hypothetical protein [Flavobacterium sp.]
MSRKKRNQNMDALIASIETIKKNQCSLSVEDLNVLNEVISKLQFLKKKKGLTDKHLQQHVVEIVELINKFFI